MGDDYTGPVTVAADDGSERVLKDINVWQQSETIMGIVEATGSGNTIPLASVPREALDKVVEYMEKMAGFAADGTSDEDKQQWISEYKKTMEAQDQLPLLFSTMTGANFMNVKTLLDELCKFVAEMIAKKTPNEILDYFNIRKKYTYGEEQRLIAKHKWIDPKGLIMKNYDEEAERLKREGPSKYGGKSTEDIINLSREITPEDMAVSLGLEGTEKEDQAATKIAAVHRGKQVRARLEEEDDYNFEDVQEFEPELPVTVQGEALGPL